MAEHKDHIQGYLNGKLTAAERHALEKKALRDPFLADALEGAQSLEANDFRSDIDELDQKLSPRKKSGWYTPLRIAAGIALVAAVGLFVWTQNNRSMERALAENETKQGKDNPAAADTSATEEKKNENLLSLNKTEAAETTVATKPASSQPVPRPEEGISESQGGEVSAEPVPQSKETLRTETPVEAELAKADPVAEDDIQKIAVTDLERAKRTVEVATGSSVLRKKEAAPSQAGAVADGSVVNHTIRGQVKTEDGQPLPGVNVWVKDSQNGTITDLNGNYSLDVRQANPRLVFSYLGYQTSEVNLNQQEKVDMALAEDPTQLNEVVVTSERPARDSDSQNGPVIRMAEPFGGRKAYDAYLEKNLRYPEQALEQKIKGRVTIEFTVGTDGSLGSFQVLRSLGHGCDEEVIRLVKEGPKWFPTTEDDVAVESNVRVRMKFDPAKAGR